jgi:hypothetical protein
LLSSDNSEVRRSPKAVISFNGASGNFTPSATKSTWRAILKLNDSRRRHMDHGFSARLMLAAPIFRLGIRLIGRFRIGFLIHVELGLSFASAVSNFEERRNSSPLSSNITA